MVVEPSEIILLTWHIVDKTSRQRSLECDMRDVMLSDVSSYEDEDMFPHQDEVKCSGAFGTFDTYEWNGIASKCR